MGSNNSSSKRKKNAIKLDENVGLYTSLQNQPGQNYQQEMDEQVGHTKIYRFFSAAQEYNLPWLDLHTQKLKLQEGEVPIIRGWTKVNLNISSTLGWRLKNLFMLFFYVIIYTLIMYFWKDRGTGLYNYSVRAFFFPLLPYILISYRSFSKYFSAIISAFAVFVISLLLFQWGVIDYNGMPLIKYFIYLIEIWPNQNLIPEVDPNSLDVIILAHKWTMGAIFGLEFIALILKRLFKKYDTLDLVVTTQNVYLRTKTQKSWWQTAKTYLGVIVSPFNGKKYEILRNRIQYNKETEQEGRKYDYSRINIKSVRKIRKSREFKPITFILSLIFLGLGIAYFIPLLFLGIVMMIIILSGKKTYRIKLVVNRSKVEGSWILTHNHNIIVFRKVPEIMAEIFKPIKKKA